MRKRMIAGVLALVAALGADRALGQGQDDAEQARVREVQTAMERLGWQVGRWQGEGTMGGQPVTVEMEAEWVLQRTFIHSRSRVRAGEQVLHEDGAMSTWSAERRRYEGYFFMPGYASRFVTEANEDCTVLRWEEMREEASDPMHARGESRRVSADEFTERVEIEAQPGQWTEVVSLRYQRVVESAPH